MTTFDIFKIAQLLIPTVGFRQTVAKKEYRDLDAALFPDTTKAQIYVNSLSELFLSVEAMSNGLVFDEGFDVDTWLVGTAYLAGQRVSLIVDDRTYVWVAVIDNTGNDPNVDDGTNWKTALSDRLEKYRESAALETISGAITGQVNEAMGSRIEQSNTIYKEVATATPVQLQGRFVGVCIKPLDYGLNRVLTIDKLGMRITGVQADLILYLFHSSKREAIKTITLKAATQDIDTFKWYTLLDSNDVADPIIIDYFNPDYNQGGVFYLGFFESDFTTNNQSYSFNEARGPYDQVLGQLYADKDVWFNNIEIPSSNLNGTELPNIGQFYDGVNYNSEIVFNLMFINNQSFFPQFERNITLLQKVYQHVLAFMLLKDMLYNGNRISKISDNAEDKIHELLYGTADNDRDKGLIVRKEAFIKQLNGDLNKIFDDFQGIFQGNV